jgi:hypothetical protein
MFGKLLCLLGFHQLVNRVVNFQGIKSHSFIETKCARCGAHFDMKPTYHREDASVLDV